MWTRNDLLKFERLVDAAGQRKVPDYFLVVEKLPDFPLESSMGALRGCADNGREVMWAQRLSIEDGPQDLFFITGA